LIKYWVLTAKNYELGSASDNNNELVPKILSHWYRQKQNNDFVPSMTTKTVRANDINNLFESMMISIMKFYNSTAQWQLVPQQLVPRQLAIFQLVPATTRPGLG
jgi:hypothetical protein